MNAVATVQSSLTEMAPDSTYDDILYQVYVMREIDKGLLAAEAGNLISQEEAKGRFEEWRRSYGQPLP